MNAESHRTVEAVWGIESPRLIAGLVRIVRDIGLAEELAQDAFVAALRSGRKKASRATLERG